LDVRGSFGKKKGEVQKSKNADFAGLGFFVVVAMCESL
jgi:hypothetical protein